MNNDDLLSEDNCEKEMLLIERKKYYNKLQQDRENYFNDTYLIKYAIDCVDYTIGYNDYRYLNLALKINDSDSIKCDKKDLRVKLNKSLSNMRLKYSK